MASVKCLQKRRLLLCATRCATLGVLLLSGTANQAAPPEAGGVLASKLVALDDVIESPPMPAAPGPYPEDPSERQQVQADTLARVGKCPQAWGLYQRAVQLDPYNLLAYDGLAYCAFRTGEPAAGAARLRLALRDNPGYDRGWLHLSRLERAAGQKLQAVGSIRKYRQKRPDDPLGQLEEARALLGIGRRAEAAAVHASYQQQAQGGADPPPARPTMPDALPASLQLSAAELALAIARDLSLSAEGQPQLPAGHSPGQELMAAAERHFARGQPLIALGLYQHAAADRQLTVEALSRAALVALSQQQLLRAQVLFRRLQTFAPQSPLIDSAHALLVVATKGAAVVDTAAVLEQANGLLRRRRYLEARRLLDRAIQQEAAAPLLLLRAKALLGLQQRPAALLDLGRAALLDPELTAALIELAEVHRLLGDRERAVFYYRVALGRRGQGALGESETAQARAALRRLVPARTPLSP